MTESSFSTRSPLRTTALLLAAGLLAACSASPSSPPSPAPDTRPLGNVTAAPEVCGLVSKQSVERATGLSDFTVQTYMSSDGKHLDSCYIYTKPRNGSGYRLRFEIDNTSPLPLKDIERIKASSDGVDLPTGSGPGYTFTLVESGVKHETAGWAWARDGSSMLTVTLAETPSNRDPQKDAAEFIRQLRPIVLDTDGAATRPSGRPK